MQLSDAIVPEDARAELDREALEAGEAFIPLATLDAPEDVLAERDAELRALQEEPANDAERPAAIDELRER
jgi:hypothetical protein